MSFLPSSHFPVGPLPLGHRNGSVDNARFVEHPFLQGRGFVFASQFSKLLQAQSATQYLEAAVQVIESTEAGAPVKISAVKAVQKCVVPFQGCKYCPVLIVHCSFYEGGDEDVLAPFAPRIARDLGPLLAITSEDTLTLVLETFSVVLGVKNGQWLSPELASAIAIACLEVWHKNNRGRMPPQMLPIEKSLTPFSFCRSDLHFAIGRYSQRARFVFW